MDRTAALHALVERYYAYALAIARRLCRGGDWSNDLAHDAFVRILAEARTVPVDEFAQRRLVSDFVHWAHANEQRHRTFALRDVRRVVHTCTLVAHLRAVTGDPTAPDADVLGTLAAFRSPGVEEALLASEEMAALARCLASLTSKERAALAGHPSKATPPARARLAALLAAAGYPHTPSRGKALPRNRSAQMKAYRQALKERRMEAA